MSFIRLRMDPDVFSTSRAITRSVALACRIRPRLQRALHVPGLKVRTPSRVIVYLWLKNEFWERSNILRRPEEEGGGGQPWAYESIIAIRKLKEFL